MRTHPADDLLGQLAEEGIEPVREMVQKQAYDRTRSDLMGRLVAVSTLLGVTCPEYAIWKRQAEEKPAQVERRMKEMWRSFQAPVTPPRPKERDEGRERKPAPFMRFEKP